MEESLNNSSVQLNSDCSASQFLASSQELATSSYQNFRSSKAFAHFLPLQHSCPQTRLILTAKGCGFMN
jgi:hypothetical protein